MSILYGSSGIWSDKYLNSAAQFLVELQVPEKQSSQNTWICQKFHLSWCCKHNK